MILTTKIVAFGIAVLFMGVYGASAEVYVPADEYISYVDANGIYTIIGNVKNTQPTDISVTVTVAVTDGITTYDHTVPPIFLQSGSELPFKVKMPQIVPPYQRLTLLEPTIVYNDGTGHTPTVSVIYDETLVLHPNGTLTGFVINDGNDTIRDVEIWAVVHGAEGALDVSASWNTIGPLSPGQTGKFVMHPDPAVADMVVYYSCFAPKSRSVYPIYAQRDNMTYNLRYESDALVYRPEFSENGTALTLQTTNSFSLETFANIEIPPVTRQETFQVYRNGIETDFIQSVDEMGMWHVAFDIRGYARDVITIRGFAPGPTLDPFVPEYIKYDAEQWLLDESNDKLLDDLFLLADIGLVSLGSQGEPYLPRWTAPLVEWYVDGTISEDEFLTAISYLVDAGVVVVYPD